MVYKVVLTELAQQDFNELDGSLKKRAAEALRKLQESPDYGEPLGNKYGLNLTGLYRLRFNDRRHRVVYQLEDKEEGLQIVVIAIGPRKDELVYKLAAGRVR